MVSVLISVVALWVVMGMMPVLLIVFVWVVLGPSWRWC